jgi:hypothetical protein
MRTPAALTGSVARAPSLGELAERGSDRLIAWILAQAQPGTRAGAALEGVLRVPWHATIAWAVFVYALTRSVAAQDARGLPIAWLALLAIPAALLLIRRPLLMALVMALAGTWLRALYLSYPETCDQLAVSRAAMGIAVSGANPYGIGYMESVPAGSPFPYGPLAMLSSTFGVPGEVIAVTGIMLILAFCRALLTLAVLAAWVPAIEFGVCGLNDQVPAVLLLAGLLLLERGRRERVAGATLLAIGAGIKPYVFAWFPALVGYGGIAVAAVLVGLSAVFWAPVLWWGVGSYLTSVEMARNTHPVPENTLNMPALRILAVPLAIISFLTRSWTVAVLSGALIFLVVLFLDWWASLGYWYVVMPILGVVAERALRRFGVSLRRADAMREESGREVQPREAVGRSSA